MALGSDFVEVLVEGRAESRSKYLRAGFRSSTEVGGLSSGTTRLVKLIIG